MQFFWFSYLLIFNLIISSYCFASSDIEETKTVYQPIQEMFQSNLVYPQEEGEIQLTFFPSYRKKTESELTRTFFEIEYGITDALQIIFEWDGLLYKNLKDGPTNSGPGNIEIGAQYSWMAMGDGNTHFSFGTLVEFPVGAVDNKLSEGLIQIQPFAVLARDFPKLNQSQIFFELGFNLADQIRNTSGDPEPSFESIFWNVGAFFPFGSWRGTLEINGSNNELDSGEINEIFVTPGIIYKLSREWEIGVAAPIGTTNTSDDYRVVGYLMWEFEFDDD